MIRVKTFEGYSLSNLDRMIESWLQGALGEAQLQLGRAGTRITSVAMAFDPEGRGAYTVVAVFE